LRYFINTHSNHLLDISIDQKDISVFSFEKIVKAEAESESKFIVRNSNAGDNQLLRNLGVNNSSVFLANSTLWVEGVSDRNYIKAFLKAYTNYYKKDKREFREDIDFAFLHYAGSNLVHYDFVDDKQDIKEDIAAFSLSNRIFLISDTDNPKQKKHKDFKEIAKQKENFEYSTTENCREIENVLSKVVWKKVLVEYCSKKTLNNSEKIRKAQEELENSIDSISAKDWKSYQSEYINKFLDSIRSKVVPINKITDDKGSIIEKAKLSRHVLNLVELGQITWEDFKENKVVLGLTEKIYNFIDRSA
jgi:hypothetical protein